MRITLRRSRLLPVLIVATSLLCLLALMLTAQQLAQVWSGPVVLVAAAAALGVLVVVTRRALGSTQFDCHALELLGHARYRLWLIGESGARDLVIHAWQPVGPLLLLEFQQAPRPLRLLLASDQCDGSDWRALRAALNWEDSGA